MITAQYSTQTIYICKEIYQPKGICYGKVCRQRKTSVRNSSPADAVSLYVSGERQILSSSITTDIKTYLTRGDNEQTMTAYILKDGDDPALVNAYPPCSDTDPFENAAGWNRLGDHINAELPLPATCGVEYFRTDFNNSIFRQDFPGHIGEADGETVSLTFDSGGYYLHRTRLDRQYLTPGCDVYVSFKARGVEGFYTFGFFRFETNIFTSAEVLGCGLAERKSIYKNILKPELGFTYIYSPSEGGAGYTAKPEWIYDTRFRYIVRFRGQNYWLRSADFAVYAPGDRVAVIKGDDFPMTPQWNITESCVKDELSESDDMIVSEKFYGRA